MRVAVDARKLHDFGIGTYIQELLLVYLALGVPEELVAYLPPGSALSSPPRPTARLLSRVEQARPYSLGELWRLALATRRDRADLFHAPHYVCPPVLPCPAVVTIHDLIHLRFPEHRKSRWAPLYARVMLHLAVRRAAGVITVSASTGRDLETWLRVPAARVRVIPNGVAPRFRPAEDPEAPEAGLAALGLAAPYWLFVGNPLPHKNLGRLLDAFAGLPKALGRLALAGIPTTARPAVEQACAMRGLAGRVLVLAPQPAEHMPLVYQGSMALVCPSLWEGFGLPVLEAMACGTPVVAADRGALPEVLGGAGLLVDPTNVDAVRDAMYNVAVDQSLRAVLRAAGLARARAFSWRATADATLAVYREVLARNASHSKVSDAGRAGP
jgi:glycosyltransferase involved in cell wall biosynthesis